MQLMSNVRAHVSSSNFQANVCQCRATEGRCSRAAVAMVGQCSVLARRATWVSISFHSRRWCPPGFQTTHDSTAKCRAGLQREHHCGLRFNADWWCHCAHIVGRTTRCPASQSQPAKNLGLWRPSVTLHSVMAVCQSLEPLSASSVSSNPSIERTSPGKPGNASHLKRWASGEASAK